VRRSPAGRLALDEIRKTIASAPDDDALLARIDDRNLRHEIVRACMKPGGLLAAPGAGS
jgi:hypothetical protein